MRLFSTGIRTMIHNAAARLTRWSVLLFGCLVVACGGITVGSCAPSGQVQATPRTPESSSRAVAGTTGHALIPLPVSVAMTPGQSFAIGPQTAVYVPAGSDDLKRVGRFLADLIGRSTEAPIEVRPATGSSGAGGISLVLDPSRDALGDEGYELTVATAAVQITARTPAGVFYGVQTLRQLMPSSIEHQAPRPHPVSIPGARIEDRPRFVWRGAMLDVARHFFGPADVRRYIDLLALYKFNRLHLHLSDDQGWRLEIRSWPNLTAHGASTAVGGGPGGYYTQQDYTELIAYARDRFITVIPEIDMPSHINAALASVPELNCDGVAPPPYTGIEVGFSNFCVDKEITYKFIDDVVREIAGLTPAPYLHIGGDEVKKITPAQYRAFMERVQGIVASHGKTPIAWDEVAAATLLPSTIVQQWRPQEKFQVPPATKVILSPAHKIYLDMQYHTATPIGLHWAAYVDVPEAYRWDPAAVLPGVNEGSILGVEAPLWSETLVTMRDVEYMAFPRLAGAAEIAWSPKASRTWDEYKGRLAAQAQRWSALGINAYWSPAVPWRH
jgi:hexosaminidase